MALETASCSQSSDDSFSDARRSKRVRSVKTEVKEFLESAKKPRVVSGKNKPPESTPKQRRISAPVKPTPANVPAVPKPELAPKKIPAPRKTVEYVFQKSNVVDEETLDNLASLSGNNPHPSVNIQILPTINLNLPAKPPKKSRPDDTVKRPENGDPYVEGDDSKTHRKDLSLQQKYDLIRDFALENNSYRVLATKYNISKSAVSTILKRKDEIIDEYEKGLNLDRHRKKRKSPYEELNKVIWEWYLTQCVNNCHVTGPQIQRTAKDFADLLNLTDFKASNGWLDSFKKEHGITRFTVRNYLSTVIPAIQEQIKRKSAQHIKQETEEVVEELGPDQFITQ